MRFCLRFCSVFFFVHTLKTQTTKHSCAVLSLVLAALISSFILISFTFGALVPFCRVAVLDLKSTSKNTLIDSRHFRQRRCNARAATQLKPSTQASFCHGPKHASRQQGCRRKQVLIAVHRCCECSFHLIQHRPDPHHARQGHPPHCIGPAGSCP